MSSMLQAFYGSNHQNSPTSPDQAIEDIKTLTPENLKVYHSENYGTGSMVLVVVVCRLCASYAHMQCEEG